MTPFVPAFIHYCRLNRQAVNHHGVVFAVEEIQQQDPSPEELITYVWQRLGKHGQPIELKSVSGAMFPLLGFHPTLGWGVAEILDLRGGFVVSNGQGEKETWTPAQIKEATFIHLPVQDIAQVDSTWSIIRNALFRHRKTLLHAALATALVNIISLAVSFYSMQVFDRVIPTGGVATLTVLTVGVALASFFEFGLKWLRGHAIDQIGAIVDSDVSSQLVARLLGTRLDVRPAQVGTLAAQVKGFDHIRSLMTSGTLFFAVDLPFGLLFLLVIALLGSFAVLPCLIVGLLCVYLGLHSARKIEALTEKIVIDSNRKNGILVEAIESAETLKASSGEWRLMRRWNDLVDTVALNDLQLRNLNSGTSYSVTLLQGLGYVAMIATGALLAMQGQLTTGALLACSILNGRALTPLTQIPSLLIQWSQAKASIKMLNTMLSLPSDSKSDNEWLTPDQTRGEIRVEALRFGYLDSPLPCINFGNTVVIGPGERVGVIGEVGSGKSTLLRLMAGLYQPQAGSVRLDGIELTHLNPNYVRSALGYLAQDYRLIGGTLRDNLTLGLADPGDAVLIHACNSTGLSQLINQNPKGLSLPISEGGRGVSGGQRQLIGLTRLILANSSVWLLDEPTASLDAGTEGLILKTLSNRNNYRSLIVVTHKQALLPLFDRLIVISQGKVALDGPRDAVIARLRAGHDASRQMST